MRITSATEPIQHQHQLLSRALSKQQHKQGQCRSARCTNKSGRAKSAAGMALRTAARRWPAASPQVQAAAALRQQSRAFADEYTGRAMGDKERAAEAQWIKKMEEEILQRKKALNAQSGTASTSTPPKAGEAPTPTTEGGFRNTAVVAGLIAAVAGYWLLSGSSKKEDKEEKESS